MTDGRAPKPPIGAKPWQSCLNPYAEEIRVWRHARLSYATIARRLAEKHELKVTRSAIHSFVRARARRRSYYELPELPRAMLSTRPEPNPRSDSERLGVQRGPLLPTAPSRRYTDSSGREVPPPPKPIDPNEL